MEHKDASRPTIGQRIAQLRRAQGLSQEALGEQLGVSRQAIYKWEQDAALPEIDKLIALSRLFGISVGALLGVEDAVPAGASAPSEELSETQLKMVEAIVQQYLEKQPAAPRRRWPKVLAVLAAAALAIVLLRLGRQLNTMQNAYQNLQASVSSLSNSVSSQIGSISSRVETILKEQNELTSDYGVELLRADLAENTVTFRVWAVPKTYTEGTSARFLALSGGQEYSAQEQADGNGRFETQLCCALSDEIVLSAVFETEGVQSTQKLETYYDLYSDSFPSITVHDYLYHASDALPDTAREEWIYASVTGTSSSAKALWAGMPENQIANLRVGLFFDQKLVCWGEPCEQPSSFRGFDNHDFYRFSASWLTSALEAGTQVCIAAVVTDSYGRDCLQTDIPYVVQEDSDGGKYLAYPASFSLDQDGWEY